MENALNVEHRLVEVEQRSLSNTHRLDKLEEETVVLNRLATAVEVMATKQDNIAEKVDGLTSKVEEIEHKPGKRWEDISGKLIYYVLAALVGFLLAQLGVM